MILLLPLILLGCAKQPFILTDSVADAIAEGVDPVWVAPHEDGMRTHGGKGTVEWWYFDAHLDDGSTVVANFMTKPIMKRGKPLTPKMEVTVTEPDGTVHQSFTFYEASQFSASAEGCDVRIGDSTVRGNLETYTLHLVAEHIQADLVLDREVVSWRPGAGKVYFDADRTDYLGWVVAVPQGSVTGTITVDGRTWDVVGSGYHDHNWTNTAINKPLDRWYWGRTGVDPYTVLFFAAEGSRRWDHAPLNLFMLAEGEPVLVSGAGGLTLTPSEFTTTKPPYPMELSLVVDQNDTLVSMEMLHPVILEQEDLLGSMPPLAQGFLHLFMRPWYYRFQVDSHLSVETPMGVSASDGKSIYELMIFR